eukprot:c10120_g1_i2.p4 GENE.c10120_g1_i2~~c10120_g1_i2.p4  ORF type:complete len:111 (+),score=39.80 c10120_g1_i2:1219-1551(+)
MDSDDQITATTLKATLQLNMAACNLKLKQHQQALDLCNKVLETDAKNTKALYRRAQAFAGLGEFKKAQTEFQNILVDDPTNTGVRAELTRLQQQMIADEKRERALFAKMF